MSESFVSHLECSNTGKTYPANKLLGLSEENKPLLVKYNLPRLKKHLKKTSLIARDIPGFWRYSLLLPVVNPDHQISLGEVVTPLIPVTNYSREIGVAKDTIFMKDESRLPTGSFKARGLALAVSMAKVFGLTHLAIPTNGNAGSAMAAYASKAEIKSTVFCPADTPEINIREIQAQGAQTFLVNGYINDCAKLIDKMKNRVGWFDLSTLKEPYRIEGKKTMGFELAEQFEYSLPDAIFYPTGGGTGLIAMWKAFNELRELGLCGSRLPKMFAVQSDGCAPIVKAWDEGKFFADNWENPKTLASGIRVPVALGDFLILRALRESGGQAIAVSDKSIIKVRNSLAQADGLLLCPEGAATLAAYQYCLNIGQVKKTEKVVLFNCASGLKYPLPPVFNRLNKDSESDLLSRFV